MEMEPENENSMLIYEPSLSQIVKFFQLLFGKIRHCISEITNIEPDLLKFLKIEQKMIFNINPMSNSEKEGRNSLTWIW